MDSLRVEIPDKTIELFAEKISKPSSIWDTIIPVLVGAGLALLAQFLVEMWKRKRENDLKKTELIAKGNAKIYHISQILKDLAMYKAHKKYYYRAYELKFAWDDSYKKHYEKGQEQRITESKFDENIAEYFQIVTEYSILSKKTKDFQGHFQKIFYFVHPQSNNFKNCNTQEELINGLKEEEKRLNQEYISFRDILEKIQTLMK
jgi:hypothetical protein